MDEFDYDEPIPATKVTVHADGTETHYKTMIVLTENAKRHIAKRKDKNRKFEEMQKRRQL